MDSEMASVRITQAICGAFVMLVLSMAGCTYGQSANESEALQAMVRSGADVIAASCAMHKLSEDACRVVLAKQK